MNFKQIKLSILILFLPGLIAAQNVDEIIAKHIEAHGGKANWEKIESIKITGQFTAFSIEREFVAIKTREGKYYSELHLGKHKVYEAFDGTEGWTIDPWQEIEFARRLSNAEKNVFYQKAAFFTPFYQYKEKGYTVEYKGIKEVEGVETYELELTRANGYKETWYLDKETYLEYKCESYWIDFAYPLKAESFYDDFRTINGVVIPFYIERMFGQRNRMLIIENVEFNSDIDESIFERPKKEGMKKLASLEGKWDVAVEAMNRAGNWQVMSKTSSTITFDPANLLHETIAYDVILPYMKVTSISYNDQTDTYWFSIFNDLSGSSEILTGKLSEEGLVADDVNIQIGNEEKQGPNFQIKFENIREDGFTVVKTTSTDKGETWVPRLKFTYTRKK